MVEYFYNWITVPFNNIYGGLQSSISKMSISAKNEIFELRFFLKVTSRLFFVCSCCRIYFATIIFLCPERYVTNVRKYVLLLFILSCALMVLSTLVEEGYLEARRIIFII